MNFVKEKFAGLLKYTTNFFMDSSDIRKKAGRCELFVGILIYIILRSNVSVLAGDNRIVRLISLLILSIPMFTLVCRRHNDVGLGYKNSIKMLAVFVFTVIGMVAVYIVGTLLTPAGRKLLSRANGDINPYLSFPTYSAETAPVFLICLAFILSLIVVLVIQTAILLLKENKLSKDGIICKVGFASAVVCSILGIALSISTFALTLKNFDKAKEDFLKSEFEIKEENLLGDDIIVQSGVFTPGVEADTIDGIKSYYDNDMKSALEGQYDYYKIGRFQIDEGIYVCPIFSQNVLSGDSVVGLIELCFVNSNNDEREIAIDKISVGEKASDIDLKVNLSSGLSFVPIEVDKIEGGEPFQFKVGDLNVITSLKSADDVASQQGQPVS